MVVCGEELFQQFPSRKKKSEVGECFKRADQQTDAVEELRDAGLTVLPPRDPGPKRMALTLAELGPRPVIELHAAGLKVGEIAVRRSRGEPGRPAADNSLYSALIQEVNG